MGMEQRVRRLENERGVDGRGQGRCVVCDDGTRPSGLVFRVAGGDSSTERPMPVCAGCGRCSALVFDIVAVHERTAVA